MCLHNLGHGPAEWLVDNSVLQCDSVGLVYRLSKQMEDKDSTGLEWDSVVEGRDCGDGWVRVQNDGRFLPMVVSGCQVAIGILKGLLPPHQGGRPPPPPTERNREPYGGILAGIRPF